MATKLTQSQVENLEKQHNVYIDADTMSYTHGERDDIYGWQPIPAEWIDKMSVTIKRNETQIRVKSPHSAALPRAAMSQLVKIKMHHCTLENHSVDALSENLKCTNQITLFCNREIDNKIGSAVFCNSLHECPYKLDGVITANFSKLNM